MVKLNSVAAKLVLTFLVWLEEQSTEEQSRIITDIERRSQEWAPPLNEDGELVMADRLPTLREAAYLVTRGDAIPPGNARIPVARVAQDIIEQLPELHAMQDEGAYKHVDTRQPIVDIITDILLHPLSQSYLSQEHLETLQKAVLDPYEMATAEAIGTTVRQCKYCHRRPIYREAVTYYPDVTIACNGCEPVRMVVCFSEGCENMVNIPRAPLCGACRERQGDRQEQENAPVNWSTISLTSIGRSLLDENTSRDE